MTLGRQPHISHISDAHVTRRAFLGSIRGLAAAVVFLLALTATMLSAGCGGSSSGGGGNGGGNNSNQTATIRGRLVDRNSGSVGIAGATVTYAAGGSNAVSTTTGADGSFSLTVRAGIGDQLLIVTPPATTSLYSTALIQGVATNILSSGFVVTALTTDEVREIGEIAVFSQNGPPPPPIFP